MNEKNPITRQFIIEEMARLKSERDARNIAAEQLTQNLLSKFMLAKVPDCGDQPK